MAAMVDTLTVSIAILAVVVLVGIIFWFQRTRRNELGIPVIELEKLVKCNSCGSQIPEGARKCAFCGAWQRPLDSGEQIKASQRNGTNAADGSH
jgi:hypothetical protein